jgi:hypothetical protein
METISVINCNVSFMRVIRLMVVALLVALVGCVQNTPVPYLARAGDTIVLGLGGIQRNVGGEQHLEATDLTITIAPAAGGTPIVPSAGLPFKAYPDYGSVLSSSVINGSYPFALFDGGWFIPVVLPDNGSLAPGSYLISVTSPTGKLINTKFATTGGFIHVSEGDLTQLPLEIIAGTGGSGTNSDYASQFIGYTNAPSLDISPSNLSSMSTVGGLQLYITYPKTAYYDPNHLPIVVPYSHNPFIQLAQNTIDNGTTKTLVVMLSTQQAFVPLAQQTPLTPLLNDLSLRVLYFITSGQQTPSATQLVSDFHIDSQSHYYDATGAVISSMTPTVTLKNR